MKVFIVFVEGCDRYYDEVAGVYTTQELTDRAMALLDGRLEEHVVDELPYNVPGKLPFWVFAHYEYSSPNIMGGDGVIDGVKYTVKRITDLTDFQGPQWECLEAGVRFHVWATNAQVAMEIAAERRQELIDIDQWQLSEEDWLSARAAGNLHVCKV